MIRELAILAGLATIAYYLNKLGIGKDKKEEDKDVKSNSKRVPK